MAHISTTLFGRRRVLTNYKVSDRISSLPDTIIWNILYFVPTKTAVMTSILSKRWRYLWTGVSALDFTEMPGDGCYQSLTLPQRTLFKSFVDRVLLHNQVSSWDYLFLTLDEHCYFYLKSWLELIAKRKITRIDIQVLNWANVVPVDLPANFFTSETLVELELWGRFVIDVPWSLHLPNLEFAHLHHFKLPNDDFVRTFSSGCPNLREFHIVDCEGLESTIHVESSTLQILVLKWNMDRMKSPHARIVIQAPNLERLHTDEYLKGQVLITTKLSALVEADVNIEQNSDINHALELLRNVAWVKTLRLKQPEYECLHYFNSLSTFSFENLTCLKIASGRNVYQLLECAPKLKFLTIEDHVHLDDFPFARKQVPECVSCLELVHFSGFKASEFEMAMVEYLLVNAMVLKEANIHIPFTDAERKAQVFQRLLVLPRSSTVCQVKVSASVS